MVKGRTGEAGGEDPLRLLLVEDAEDDALLIVRALRRAGFSVRHRRVDSATDLAAALEESAWDVVTCDWVMPALNATVAIDLIRAQAPRLPIIAVSGERRDEVVVGALRAGARHFVGKDNLALLAPIIEAVLCDGGKPRVVRRGEAALTLVAQRR